MDIKNLKKQEVIAIYKNVLNGNLKRFPCGMWQVENSKMYFKYCLKYFLSEEMCWTKKDIKKRVSYNMFRKAKLSHPLESFYQDSPYKAITTIYPDINPWELNNVPRNYWNKENAIKATKWLFEKKLKKHPKDVKVNNYYSVFKKYNLEGMLVVVYSTSANSAIFDSYPEYKDNKGGNTIDV